jgi:hypothetical protein
MTQPHTEQRNRVNFVTIAILSIGLVSALVIYLTAGDTADIPL